MIVKCNSRNKQSTHPNRLLDHKVPCSRQRARHDLSMCPQRLTLEPIDIAGRIRRLALGIHIALAVLPDDQAGDILQVLLHECIQLGEHGLSLKGGGVAEGFERLMGGFDSSACVLEVHLGAGADDFPCCGVLRVSYFY